MDSFDAPGNPPQRSAMDDQDDQHVAHGVAGRDTDVSAHWCDDVLHDYLSGAAPADYFVIVQDWDGPECGDFATYGDRIGAPASPVPALEFGAGADAFLFDWDDPGGTTLTGGMLDDLHRML